MPCIIAKIILEHDVIYHGFVRSIRRVPRNPHQAQRSNTRSSSSTKHINQQSHPKTISAETLKSFDVALTKELNQEYETLFFKQLEKVIVSNTIKSKLFESRLNSIVAEAEKHLSTLALPPEEIDAIHKKFLLENHIKDHVPNPCLQSKLQPTKETRTARPPSPPQRKRTRPKRKATTPHPEPEKHRKPNNFLSQGHQNLLTQS